MVKFSLGLFLKKVKFMKNIPKPERNWTQKESELYLLAEQGRFDEALDLISKIQNEDDPKILLLKLQCYLRSGKPFEALKIAMDLENDGLTFPQLFLLKGQCLFNLKEYSSALLSFKKCYSESSTPEIERWIQKCQVHLTQKASLQPEVIFDFVPDQNDELNIQENTEPIINYDYFQNLTHVVLLIDVIGAKKDKSYVKFQKKSVDVYIDKYDANLHFPLASEIDPNQSSFTIGPYSIECKLHKAEQGDWTKFEETDEPNEHE